MKKRKYKRIIASLEAENAGLKAENDKLLDMAKIIDYERKKFAEENCRLMAMLDPDVISAILESISEQT